MGDGFNFSFQPATFPNSLRYAARRPLVFPQRVGSQNQTWRVKGSPISVSGQARKSVMNRGDRREPIFRDNANRQRFVETKGTWVRLFQPPAKGRLERGFQGLDVGDHVHVKLIHTDVERGFIDFVRD
jgi:hypothetical protein